MQFSDKFFYRLIPTKDRQKPEPKLDSERLKHHEKWSNNKVIEVVISIENL